jgi:hypothetical protein
MFPYIAVAAFALLFGGQFLLQRRRSAAMKRLAAQLGFMYIGGALPRSFSLAGTGLEAVSSIWNVIDGDRNGVRLIAFDCRIGRGKGSWTRTVIAAQSTVDLLGPVTEPELTVEHSGAWTILCQPQALFNIRGWGFMPIAEVRARLEGING